MLTGYRQVAFLHTGGKDGFFHKIYSFWYMSLCYYYEQKVVIY